MAPEQSLAEILAANRARGTVQASARSLFPRPELPSWESLRLTWHVRLLCLFLGLYFVSLYLVWSRILAVPPFAVRDYAPFLFAAAANYCLLIGTASVIMSRLHAAELAKYGGMLWIYLAVFLNPLVLGWSVPLYVLSRVAEVRRRLSASAAKPRSFG